MRIVGEWLVGDDGGTRPVVELRVQASDGGWKPERFLVDSGADRTVLSAEMLKALGFATAPAPAGLVLEGVGGESAFVLVRTVVRLPGDDGGAANIHGEFAAFTDASATDLSILGRDVLDIFDLIQSRRRNEVLLLAKEHTYRVVTA